jgi:hypothetical protein
MYELVEFRTKRLATALVWKPGCSSFVSHVLEVQAGCQARVTSKAEKTKRAIPKRKRGGELAPAAAYYPTRNYLLG